MLFNDFPYRDIYEMTRWVKDYGIHLIVANEVNVNRSGMVTVKRYGTPTASKSV